MCPAGFYRFKYAKKKGRENKVPNIGRVRNDDFGYSYVEISASTSVEG